MPVAAHEFSRIALLAELPGERLSDLAGRMRREQVAPGQAIVREGEDGDRFYVVLSGMLAVSQSAGSILRMNSGSRSVRSTLAPA